MDTRTATQRPLRRPPPEHASTSRAARTTAPAAPGAATGAAGHSDHDGHDHSALPGWGRIGAALLAATGAELLHLLGPDTPLWHGAGMALAAAAILLAGLGVYRSGVRSLLRRQLGISALMAVAVTGAFAIGQWPEAAMVMALYALAELHRRARRGPRAPRHRRAARAQPRPGRRARTRWPVAERAGRAGGRGQHGARAPRRARAAGRHRGARAQRGRRVQRDGREPARGQGPRRPAVCRHDQRPVRAGAARDGRRRPHHARPHRPRCRAGPGHARADAALRRPLCRASTRRPSLRWLPAVAVGAPLLLGWSWLDAIYRRWCCW